MPSPHSAETKTNAPQLQKKKSPMNLHAEAGQTGWPQREGQDREAVCRIVFQESKLRNCVSSGIGSKPHLWLLVFSLLF